MPNLQDVADQINARLDQISTNTSATADNTADVRNELVQTNSRLAQIDATLTTGFANLSQGVFALIQVQIIAAGLLDHNRKQNDTIICELANSNTLLCNILRKLALQLRIVHALEAGDVDRHRELLGQVQACCPPDPPPQEPCPAVCPPPVYRERQPTGQDWKPLPPPQRPIG